MAQKKETKTTTVPKNTNLPNAMFTRENFIWMLAGAVIIALGFILMAGGKSEDPNVFNEAEVYSTTRITIAPILILAGLAIEIFAIFRNPRS